MAKDLPRWKQAPLHFYMLSLKIPHEYFKKKYFSYTQKIQCKGVKKKNKRSEVRLKAIQLGWKRGEMQRTESYPRASTPALLSSPFLQVSGQTHLSEAGRLLPPPSITSPRAHRGGHEPAAESLLPLVGLRRPAAARREPGPGWAASSRSPAPLGRATQGGDDVQRQGRWERRDLESCQGLRPDRGQRTPPLGKGPSCLEKRCGDVFWENICN